MTPPDVPSKKVAMIQVDKYVVGGGKGFITLNKPLTLTVKQGLLVVCVFWLLNSNWGIHVLKRAQGCEIWFGKKNPA